MSKIDDKHKQLKNSGLDLGAPLGPEQDEHSGGRVRRYEHGNIYFHPNTGAHEVHGGILALYLANGGPGPSPKTGRRELGYPTTDEIQGVPPHSQFEWGEIYWTQGTGGCIIHGPIWGRYRQGPGIGLPITSHIAIAGGEAAFFERGAIFWAAAAGKTRVITGFLNPPLMGQPELIDLGASPPAQFGLDFRWALIMKEDHEALLGLRPNIYSDIVAARYSVMPSGRPNERIAMNVGPQRVSGTPFQMDVHVPLTVPASSLKDRTLYDLRCALPNGNHYALSPHCFYAKKAWDDFGLLHVTDIHISKRNDDFRARLQQGGLTDAANNYSNFQDNFRDFIKYANKLHSLGLADAVLATGDLVDYAAEDGDIRGVRDNFMRLRSLILGEPFGHGSVVGEELKVPIFTTMGNHDYRVHPYHLRANIDVPGGDNDKALNEYASHNLLESDAISLQAEKTPTFGLTDAEEALRPLWTDQAGNSYKYFDKYFSGKRNYIVKLGKNRLVVLDTQKDEGVPELINSALLLQLVTDTANESTKRLLSGHGPNSVGLSDPQIGLVKNAVHEAGDEGTVIVGMHAPAISPKGGEYPYYMRETIHPTASPALTDGYVARNGLNGATWSRTGTAFFKTGTTEDGLNVGIGWTRNREFLEACAGVGSTRPVDLILCGHVHNFIEYRFRHTGGGFEFYMDFYSENPTVFYPTTNLPAISQQLPADAKIAIEVVEGANLPPAVAVVRDHRGTGGTGVPATESGKVRVPPYPNPLDKAQDPKTWWQAHRPIHAQTSSLGPIDSRQRFGTFYRITNPPQDYRPVIESDRGFALGAFDGVTPIARPFRSPAFQGFRLIQVQDNVIAKMRYIRLAELRKNKFKMPWEPRSHVFDPGGVIVRGELEVLR